MMGTVLASPLPSNLDPEAVDALRNQLGGQLLLPDEGGFGMA
jgi:hypothetical protein